MKRLYRLKPDGKITLNKTVVAFITDDGDGRFSARGFFGEVYATGNDRVKVAREAVNTKRLGRVPKGAAL